MSEKQLTAIARKIIDADPFKRAVYQKHGVRYLNAVRDALAAGDIQPC
jgi:hypothetical protein